MLNTVSGKAKWNLIIGKTALEIVLKFYNFCLNIITENLIL